MLSSPIAAEKAFRFRDQLRALPTWITDLGKTSDRFEPRWVVIIVWRVRNQENASVQREGNSSKTRPET